MSKFDMKKVSGFQEKAEALKNGTLGAETEAMALAGAGLLNETSEEFRDNRMQIVYYKTVEIVPNKLNQLSISQIAELAQNIELNGLDQPLVVRIAEDGSVVLLTGHRRLTAIKMLQEQGRWKSEYVPCILKDLNKMNLPLPDLLKEKLSIHSTNQQREKTDRDRWVEFQDYKEIYAALRKAGVEVLEVGTDEEGGPVTQQIAGVKTRELISQSTGMSPAQVQNLQGIENRGSRELQQALLDNKVTIYTAKAIAEVSKETQKKFLEQMDGREDEKKITNADLNSYLIKKEEENGSDGQDGRHVISQKVLQKDLKNIRKLIRDEVGLDPEEYFSYTNAIGRIEKIFQKAKEDRENRQ